MNHCPVYVRIGGHAYGHVYPGPIGKILTPQMEGLERTGVLATASSLCGACGEVCPVQIPIPDLIRRLRNESYDQDGSAVVAGGDIKRIWLRRWCGKVGSWPTGHRCSMK
jgi:L-lactate dehydrogenase complex protein LldF